MLIDKVHVLVQAGDGGNGCESYFNRTDKKFVPNGGDGGKGGSVIFRSSTNAPSLATFRSKQHLIAESGGHGGSTHKRGRNGKDLIVVVPVGTRIYDRKRKFLIRDLKEDQMEVTVLEGGKPGVGNHGGKDATPGEKGAALDLDIHFRIPAEIFMVGLPNSGKSALLNKLTRSHAAERHYPFATKSPEIGVFETSHFEQRTLCELPSVYRGSHEGRGAGSDFLRHLENAKLILYIVDPVSEFVSSLSEGMTVLKHEISLIDENYLRIPSAVAVTKMDLPDSEKRVKQEKFEPGMPCYYLSVHSGKGMPEFMRFLEEKKENPPHA